MASGGARNRSGPGLDPNSLRSAGRDIKLTALPSEGYQGEIPDFPLPDASSREIAVWEQEWRSPVACWWAMRSDLHSKVALYVRYQVLIEAGDAKGTDINLYLRVGDQIAASTAGLKENGLAIATDEVARKRGASTSPAVRTSARDRIKVVPGDGA